MPLLIPPLGHFITLEQAEAVLGHYAHDAGDLAARVALTLRELGYNVYSAIVFTPDDLVRTWPRELPAAMIAIVNYQPSSAIPYDAVQIRVEKATGELVIWDGRGVLTNTHG